MALRVDFNELDGDEIWVALRRVFIKPLVGAVVEISDGEGCSCFATVISRRDRSATCRLIWSTWRSISYQQNGRYNDGNWVLV